MNERRIDAPEEEWRVFCENCDWEENHLRTRDRAIFLGGWHAAECDDSDHYAIRIQKILLK